MGKWQRFFEVVLMVIATMSTLVAPVLLAGMAWSQPVWGFGQYVACVYLFVVFWSIAIMVQLVYRRYRAAQHKLT